MWLQMPFTGVLGSPVVLIATCNVVGKYRDLQWLFNVVDGTKYYNQDPRPDKYVGPWLIRDVPVGSSRTFWFLDDPREVVVMDDFKGAVLWRNVSRLRFTWIAACVT
jgi:hypothetical protein